MKNMLKYALLAFALMLSASASAHAGGDDWWWWGPPPGHPPPHSTAPEVDPSLAMGGITLLAGTLTVLRSRRRR